MKYAKISPSPLKGIITPPPSKSISHRLIIASSLARGESLIKNVLLSSDIKATIKGIEALGAQLEYAPVKNKHKYFDLKITSQGFPRIKNTLLDCQESGSTLRFLIPIFALTDKEITLQGQGRLRQRPLEIYENIFKKQRLPYSNQAGYLPLSFRGPLKAGDFQLPGNISSQFVSGLLFALPLLEQDSRIILTSPLESKNYVDLTIDCLKQYSIEIENDNYETFSIKGQQEYIAQSSSVEADYSQAAFWLVAGTLNGQISCQGLSLDSLQGDKAILKLLKNMGGKLKEEKGSLEVSTAPTKASTIDASHWPDLVPILAVLASLSQGQTKIINAQRLKYKESDRLNSTASQLAILGAQVKEYPDSLIIQGQMQLEGGLVDSHNDHRIAMAMAIAAIRCQKPVIIKNSASVDKSYPHFWQDYASLGGNIHEFVLRE